MKKITACIVVALIVLLLPMTVSAQETTLTTAIPSNHTLHIEIIGKGTVVVDGVSYAETTDVQLVRHSQPIISLNSGNVVCATINSEDITNKIQNGNWTMPQIIDDSRLCVTFRETPNNPATGDTVNIPLLFAVAVMSLFGMLVCLCIQRKIK